MRSVAQRCLSAQVEVSGGVVGQVQRGLVAFVAAGEGDGEDDAAYIADKLANLRVFPGEDGAPRMQASLLDRGFGLLLVPQFTLYGDVRRGRRPDFRGAAAPEDGRRLLDRVAECSRALGATVAEGQFGADMTVTVVNWGPITVLLDSARAF